MSGAIKNNEDDGVVSGNETQESVDVVRLEGNREQEEQEDSSSISSSFPNDAIVTNSDLNGLDSNSTTPQKESSDEGSDRRNSQGQEATTDNTGISRDLDKQDLNQELKINAPPEALVGTRPSISNNVEEHKQEEDAPSDEDEKSHAHVMAPPPASSRNEQVDPRDRKMPASSENQQLRATSTASARVVGDDKSAYQTPALASVGATNERVGAFREEPSATRPAANTKRSLESEELESAHEQQDEESAPLTIIHATLVVEDDSENTRRQESHPSVTRGERSNTNDMHVDADADLEEGSEICRRQDMASNDGTAVVSDMHSNVVVEHVVMDEHLTEHPRPLQLVEATRLDAQKSRCRRPCKVWIYFVLGVVLFAIILPMAIFVGVNNKSGNDEDGVSPTPPLKEEDIGNTTESFVRDVLPYYSQVALEDPRSPQSLALEWLWHDPNATSMLPNFRRVQRYALATVFFAMAQSEDRENIQRTGWLTEEHECGWITNNAPVAACDEDEFQALHLRNYLLDGTIPAELSLLSKLVSVDFSDNFVFGTLPTELGYLSSMDIFLVENNALTGPIPTQIGLCTALRHYSLSNNQLTSTIPTELGRLTTLYRLDLDFNMLTGGLPSEIGQMSALHLLILHNNTLTGTIPAEFGGLLELDLLTLYDTKLTGSVPPAVCDLFDSGELTDLTVDCAEVSCFCNCSCLNSIV